MNAEAPRAAVRRFTSWLEHRINLTELFSFVTHFGLVYTPVDTTRPYEEAAGDIGRRRLSAYASGARIFGVVAVLLFALEAVTGALLAFYYRPTPAAAFESTRMIVRDVPFGWFVHQIHSWGAYALIAVVTFRLLRLFWEGLYRAPREVLWWAAVCMAWFAVQLDLTGRLLPWDDRSYWSVVRALEVAYSLPVYGPILAYFVGGHVVNEDVLLRFYVLHVMTLPALFLCAIYLTFATLRRVGLSPQRDDASVRSITYRDHFYSLATLTLVLFGVLVTLAALVPFRFGAPADPFTTPVGVHPPWYLLAPYFWMEKLPGPAGLRGAVWLLAALAVLLLPVWVRGPVSQERLSRERLWGAVAMAAWCLLGVAGYWVERR